MRFVDDLDSLFGLDPDHSLKLLSKQRLEKDGNWYETRWLDEHDESHKLVARFRAWMKQGTQPPYQRQIGWERYSLSGQLLDREVRYSKRDNPGYVH